MSRNTNRSSEGSRGNINPSPHPCGIDLDTLTDAERPRRERLVTQVVDGEAIWTGFNRLDHGAVTAELVAQGYSLISTDTLTYKLDRATYRQAPEKPTPVAAIVELFELQE